MVYRFGYWGDRKAGVNNKKGRPGRKGTPPPITVAPSTVTWNPSDKSADITLSNGNLTMTNSGAGHDGVRATVGKSSGKYYYEVVMVSNIGFGREIIGIADSGHSLTTFVGAGAAGYSWQVSSTLKWNNSVSAAYGVEAGPSAGDVIGVLLDLGAGTLSYTIRGVSEGTAFSGLSGTFYPMHSNLSVSVTTVRFKSSQWTYTPPAGYLQWTV